MSQQSTLDKASNGWRVRAVVRQRHPAPIPWTAILAHDLLLETVTPFKREISSPIASTTGYRLPFLLLTSDGFLTPITVQLNGTHEGEGPGFNLPEMTDLCVFLLMLKKSLPKTRHRKECLEDQARQLTSNPIQQHLTFKNLTYFHEVIKDQHVRKQTMEEFRNMLKGVVGEDSRIVRDLRTLIDMSREEKVGLVSVVKGDFEMDRRWDRRVAKAVHSISRGDDFSR